MGSSQPVVLTVDQRTRSKNSMSPEVWVRSTQGVVEFCRRSRRGRRVLERLTTIMAGLIFCSAIRVDDDLGIVDGVVDGDVHVVRLYVYAELKPLL